MDSFDHLMTVQMGVFAVMLATFGIGIRFVRRQRQRFEIPTIHLNVTRIERELGVRYSLSSEYSRYRAPMRILRRFCGWPSGRQWVLLRKHWNRERPDGARRFANVVARFWATNAPAPQESPK